MKLLLAIVLIATAILFAACTPLPSLEDEDVLPNLIPCDLIPDASFPDVDAGIRFGSCP